MMHLLLSLILSISLGVKAAPGYLGGGGGSLPAAAHAPYLGGYGHGYGYAHAPAAYSYGHGHDSLLGASYAHAPAAYSYGHGHGRLFGASYAHAPALGVAKVAVAPALAYSAPLAKYEHATYAHAPLALSHAPALPLGYGHGHLGHAPAWLGNHAPALAYAHDSHAW